MDLVTETCHGGAFDVIVTIIAAVIVLVIRSMRNVKEIEGVMKNGQSDINRLRLKLLSAEEENRQLADELAYARALQAYDAADEPGEGDLPF